MPRKVRQLIADLERAEFVDRGGKGSHRNYVHPRGPRVTVSGKPGDDAYHYQEKQIR
jgi:predicted RNA binding protein YcfA (HicA-like mRNA interferase family)